MGLTKSSERTRNWIFAIDGAVLALILLIGAIQFTYYPHTADFVSDPGYPDMARSLLDRGSYQFDYLPETTLPPGFPLILALAGRFWGLSPAVLFRVIAVFTTLGLIAAYFLLRRLERRAVAAAVCLILGFSPSLFRFSTGIVFPEMPFFSVSMLGLLLALKIDRAGPGRPAIGWMLLLGADLALAVLIRSVGIALLIGLGTWCVTSLLVVPEIGRRRLRRFLLPLALGAAAQAGWSAWAQRHQVLEWQLPGYPQSYLSQLKVKNGQYPELGMARLGDIPIRVERNLVAQTAGFGGLLTRRHISPFWPSPAIAGVLILVALGLASSFRNGGQLHDWYFLLYGAIFLLWPWDYRDRFLYPVAPLACLYLWRGAKVVGYNSIRRPKAIGLSVFLLGCVLSVSSAAFAFRIWAFPVDIDHARGDHLQTVAGTVFWVILTVLGLGAFLFHSPRNSLDHARPFVWLRRIHGFERSVPLRVLAILILTVFVGSGIARLLVIGRDNLSPDITKQPSYAEIEAAEWIRMNEPSNRVIMARDQDIVFHYTGRRVVWFPPISDPKVLMDGIRRYRVGVLVVAHHSESYWLPPEEACLQSLLQTYGSAFHAVNRGRDYQVFEVAAAPDGTQADPGKRGNGFE